MDVATSIKASDALSFRRLIFASGIVEGESFGLAEHFIGPKSGIAKEKFDEEVLGLDGLGVMGSEGMPPPVVAFGCLGA